VFDPALTEPVARVLGSLGAQRAFVVHGSDGCDEVTIAGETRVSALEDGRVRTFSFTPESVGMARAAAESLRGGTAEENAATISAILGGEPGPRRDAVVLNAAFVIVAAGRRDTIADGVHLACESIDSGRARATLDNLRAITGRLAARAA
jgi:anthranilate phosphoribosyltransferase